MNRFIRISPLDLTPNRAVGVSIPFNGPAVFNSTYTTRDQMRSNLINFFLTNQGERVFNVFFGANLRKTIFEQISSGVIEGLDSLVLNALDLYFSKLIVKDLKITGYPDSGTIQIYLAYSVSETNIQDEITLSFQR